MSTRDEDFARNHETVRQVSASLAARCDDLCEQFAPRELAARILTPARVAVVAGLLVGLGVTAVIVQRLKH
ncbi:MAG TPA: hypothetical protein GX406_01005 [Pseudoclavibacter sp.]|nr:hypothetical protein [Pseudoclavibacter sp.]